MTIISVPQLLAGGRPDHHVVATRGAAVLTLARLRAEAAHTSRQLIARGARSGLLVCNDSFQFLVGMVGLLGAGADVVLPPNSRPGTLASLDGAFDVLVSDQPQPDVTDALMLDGQGADAACPAIDPARTRISFFTSGSTGQAKRVEKSLAMLESESMTLETVWGRQAEASPATGTVTHQHIYGLAFRVMWPLLAGRPFSAPVHDTWEGVLADLPAGATIVSSPAHLTRLAGLPRLAPDRRPALIFTAGGPLPANARADVAAIFGIVPTEIFGSTETGALAFRSTLDEPPLWQALPGVDVATNDAGLLRVRSSYVAGGSCELADKAALTDDGRFSFEGRADRIVKIEGRRVSLPQLERAMMLLRWVQDVAVATVPPGHTALGAIVVLSAEGQAALARLGKFRLERMLRQELANTHEPASLPRRWRFVSEIPSDGMGKRRQRDLAVLLDPGPSA